MKGDVGLLDTNLLVYQLDTTSPFHGVAHALVEDVLTGEVFGCLAMQVLTEFCATATDPRRLTVPLSPAAARVEVEKLLASPVPLLYQSREAAGIFARLIARHSISRQHVHDAALAATMLANGVTRIYTANSADFAMFDEIEVVNPFDAPPDRE